MGCRLMLLSSMSQCERKKLQGQVLFYVIYVGCICCVGQSKCGGSLRCILIVFWNCEAHLFHSLCLDGLYANRAIS
jgi:hypothetical protein